VLGLILLLGVGRLLAAEPQPAPTNPGLAKLEAQVRAAPDSLPRTHAYRLAARKAERLPEAIAVLEELIALHPDAIAPRMDLALALIDQLHDPKLDQARRGVLVSQAARQLTRIVDADGSNWAGRYVRGMVELLWPRGSQHAQLAIADFERLVAIQEAEEKPEGYFTHAYIGLGDAYVKNVQPQQARAAWKAGRIHFPDDPELTRRLAMSLREMDAFVLDTYRLDRPFATDLSFLWMK
jgi:hypothetical protein